MARNKPARRSDEDFEALLKQVEAETSDVVVPTEFPEESPSPELEEDDPPTPFVQPPEPEELEQPQYVEPALRVQPLRQQEHKPAPREIVPVRTLKEQTRLEMEVGRARVLARSGGKGA